MKGFLALLVVALIASSVTASDSIKKSEKSSKSSSTVSEPAHGKSKKNVTKKEEHKQTAFDHVFNNPPTVMQNVATFLTPVGIPFEKDISSAFGDRDGDALLYSATGLPWGVKFDRNRGVLFGTPQMVGRATIIVSATDGKATASLTPFLLVICNADGTPPTDAPVAVPAAKGDGAKGDGNILAQRAPPQMNRAHGKSHGKSGGKAGGKSHGKAHGKSRGHGRRH